MAMRWFAACLLVCVCPLVGHAQPFVLDGSSYSYLHSPWFQIEDCSFADGCAFELSGVFVLEYDEHDNRLDWLATELELSGKEHWLEHASLDQAPITGQRVAELLKEREWTFVSSDGETSAFAWGRGDLELSLSSNSVRLDGGYDLRMADGDGIFFAAEGVRTWFGDANLDLTFDSKDLVQVFRAGLFEDDQSHAASWADGDWNADNKFDTNDLMHAFQEGGYEEGPRVGVNRVDVNEVPEPTSLSLMLAGLFGISMMRRR